MLEGEPWPNSQPGIPSSATSRYNPSLDSAILAIVFLPTPSNHMTFAQTRDSASPTLLSLTISTMGRSGGAPYQPRSLQPRVPVSLLRTTTSRPIFPPFSTQTDCIFRI